MCKRDSSAVIKNTRTSYSIENSGIPVKVLEIDSRGIDFIEFKADGAFSCQGEESNTQFPEFDLEDGEWYDYDEKAGQEVSISDVKWTIEKL